MAKSTFGERLREIRERRELTQAELAAVSGIAVTSICHLEGGRRLPSFSNLRRIAIGFRLSPGELFFLVIG